MFRKYGKVNFLCLVLIISIFILKIHCDVTSFKFIEFHYKETKKNEILFQEFEAACQQTNSCVARKGIEYVRCVRECISPSCYSVIYKNDELEDGEIDVRLNSFKGCFTQRTRNRNL